MYCKNHSNNKVTNTCSMCGEWICEDCLLNIKERNFCKDCLKETLENNNYLQKAESSQLKIEEHTDKTASLKNTLSYIDKKVGLKEILFYGISLIPGCGQIYLGKSIKGISFLLLMGYSIYLGDYFKYILSISTALRVNISTVLCGFAVSMYFCSFFDALILNRKIKNNSDELYPNINKKPNFLLTLCFSLIPGCGQMYLGYTQYGAILNIIFCVLFFLAESTIPFVIALYLFSIFNTIYLRKQILNGIYFDDSLKSILKIIKPSFSNNKVKKEVIIDKRIKKSEREN